MAHTSVLFRGIEITLLHTLTEQMPEFSLTDITTSFLWWWTEGKLKLIHIERNWAFPKLYTWRTDV